jgi:hypothetical protein
VVDGDPLDDIVLLQRSTAIHMVIQAGRVVAEAGVRT